MKLNYIILRLMKGDSYTETYMKAAVKEKILNRLFVLSKDDNFLRKNVHLEEPNKYITAKRILQKGVYQTACFCHACGTKYTVEDTYGSYYAIGNKFHCPVCGNDKIIGKPGRCDTSNGSDRQHHKFIHKTDNGFEFVNFYTYDVFPDHQNWYDKNAELGITITSVGIFDNDHGYFVATNGVGYYGWHRSNAAYKVLRKNSSDERGIVFWLKDFTDTDMPREECEALLNNARKHYDMQAEQAKEKSEKRKAKKEAAAQEAERIRLEEQKRRQEAYELEKQADPRWQYKSLTMSREQFNDHRFLYRLYSTDTDEQSTHLVCCTKCGKIEEVVDLGYGRPYDCICGNHVDEIDNYKYQPTRHTQTAVVFENTQFEENDLLIRLFSMESYLTEDGKLDYEIREFERIFARKDSFSVYYKRDKKSDFDKEREPVLSSLESDYCLVQDQDTIIEIVQNSCLQYSGLLDSWGLGKYQYNWSLEIPSLLYLRAWYENKCIETIFKSNMTKIAKYFIDSGYSTNQLKLLNANGKNLAEILNVSPNLLKIARPMDPSYETLRSMQSMYECDNTMTREVYEEIINLHLPTRHFTDLMERYGIRYSKALQYLQTAYDHQCIDKSECLNVWTDYLRMASAIGVNLSDKSKRFPTSLKKEHDIAVFAYRTVKLEIDQKIFEERAQINKDRYEYENDEFVAIVPKSPQEIIEEANAQNNCLRSYVERVRKGETVVVFIRKKDKPTVTYISAEIFDDRLTQLKGYCNSDPRPDAIIKFVSEWSREKSFIPSCL